MKDYKAISKQFGVHPSAVRKIISKTDLALSSPCMDALVQILASAFLCGVTVHEVSMFVYTAAIVQKHLSSFD